MSQVESGSAVRVLSAAATVASEPSGIDTFARYIWQAKMAVRLWLTCLVGPDAPVFVVCEHVEDVTVVHHDRVRFIQLKTRDRGSWSAAKMCATGMDALARSYGAAREAGVHEFCQFELWLEGPIAEAPETVAFVEDPRRAGANLHDKIVSQGVDPRWLADFLKRLTIRHGQPPRNCVDAIVIRELGVIWPALSMPELELLYERLLTAAVAAQAAHQQSGSVAAMLAASGIVTAFLDPGPEPSSIPEDLAAIRAQILVREALCALSPPLPGDPIDILIARMATGQAASMLELKLRGAGATSATVQQAQGLRAEMEVQRQLILASRGQESGERQLERLAALVLTVAQAVATEVHLSQASNPVMASRPGEAISAHLLARISNLSHLDRDNLFNGDGLMVYGFLAHLSDECRFPWRAA
jgi:Cap4-like dsDNA endonuclease family protein